MIDDKQFQNWERTGVSSRAARWGGGSDRVRESTLNMIYTTTSRVVWISLSDSIRSLLYI
jgi:hypothetical protein